MREVLLGRILSRPCPVTGALVTRGSNCAQAPEARHVYSTPHSPNISKPQRGDMRTPVRVLTRIAFMPLLRSLGMTLLWFYKHGAPLELFRMDHGAFRPQLGTAIGVTGCNARTESGAIPPPSGGSFTMHPAQFAERIEAGKFEVLLLSDVQAAENPSGDRAVSRRAALSGVFST